MVRLLHICPFFKCLEYRMLTFVQVAINGLKSFFNVFFVFKIFVFLFCLFLFVLLCKAYFLIYKIKATLGGKQLQTLTHC